MGSTVSSNVYPCLYYDDAGAAVEWLCRAFGFTSRLAVPGPDGTLRHSELSLGPGVVMVRSARPEEDCVSPKGLPAIHMVLSLYVEDPDAHFRRARDAGAEILQEPEETTFGARGYLARDPEGNRWFFASYRPGEYWETE